MFYYYYHHHNHHYHNRVSCQQPHSITHLQSTTLIHHYHHDHLVLKLLEVPSKFWTDGNVSSIGEWWTMMMRRRIMIVMIIIMMRHRLDCWRCYNVCKYHRISASYNNSNYAFLSEYSHWIDDYWTDIHCKSDCAFLSEDSHWIDDYWTDIHCKSDCAFLSEDCYRIDDYWTDTGSVHHIPRHEVVHLLNHQPISYRSTSTIVGVITVFS